MSENIGNVINGITPAGTVQQLKSIGNLLINSNSISQLDDVNIVAPATNQIISYNGTSSKWENKNLLFASSLADVAITSPQDSDKLIYSSTVAKWINSQPYYYSITIYGKFKDSYIQSMISSTSAINMLNNDPLIFDSYNISSNNNYGLVLDTNNFLSNFRTSCNYSFESSITLSILTVANASSFTSGIKKSDQFGTGSTIFYTNSLNSLNNSTKTLNSLGIFATNGLYAPYFQATTGNNYTGNTIQDFSFNLNVYEV